MSVVLSRFQHIRPRHEIDQESIQKWVAEAHARAAYHFENRDMDSFREELLQKMNRIGLSKGKIESRGIHIHDLVEKEWSKMEIYPLEDSPQGQGFTARSECFDREVFQIFERFYPENLPLPDHLIHVTCTGYVAPSPAQKLVSSRHAGATTTVTHAYHMGCYGSIPAIRMGIGFMALPFSPSCWIDIVHTEVCSLHMQPLRHTSEQLLVESLFGDGFIKYSLSKKTNSPHFKILAVHEEIIPHSLHCMTWACKTHGLGMTLSKETPSLISRATCDYLTRLCALAKQNRSHVMKEALFAIHPGGPKILQQIQDLLGLEIEQINHSVQSLKRFGNMSSATLPHIWEKVLSDPCVTSGTLVVSLAFGPGLSVSGGLFVKEG